MDLWKTFEYFLTISFFLLQHPQINNSSVSPQNLR